MGTWGRHTTVTTPTPAFKVGGERRLTGTQNWVPDVHTVNNSSEIYSRENPWPVPPGRKGVFDHGWAFFLMKDTHYASLHNYSSSNYRGVVSARPHVTGFTPKVSVRPDYGNVRGLGTTLLSRALPTLPQANLAVSLGELIADGPPKMIGLNAIRSLVPGKPTSRNQRKKAIAGEYLNYEFGWAPLISDLRALCHSVKNANKIIASYVAGSDTHIRRRRAFPEVTEVRGISGSVPLLPTSFAVTLAGSLTETYTENVWFSGAFRYHIPIGDTVRERLLEYESKANYLLGTRITPSVVWELTPWSWLTDWFANIGDIMTSAVALGSDGLAMHYGYAMCHRKVVIDVNCSASNSFMTGRPTYRRVTEYKTRVRASPYGFDVEWENWGTLSLKQLAILAALGISQGSPTAKRR